MRNFNLTLAFLAILSFLTITTANAYTRNNYSCCGGWYASFEPFHVKFDDGLFSRAPYAYSFVDLDDEQIIRTFKFPSDFNWGFRVAVGYDCPSCSPCTNYGLSLEYTKFNNKDSEHTPFFTDPDTDLELQAVGTLYSAGQRLNSEEHPFSHADASLSMHYHTLDLLAHQNSLFCNCAKIQVFSGIRYLHLKEEFHEFLGFQEDEETISFVDNIDIGNKFDGIGPRIGANLFYPIFGCFGISTEASGVLLYGQHRSHFDETFIEEDVEDITISDIDTHTDHNENFVVGVGGKVALVYNRTLCNCSSLTLEFGYRGDKYFNIIDNRAFIDALTVTLGSVDAVYNTFDFTNKDTNLQDFSFSGPYFSITYHT